MKKGDADLEYLNDDIWLDHGKPVIAGTRLYVKDLVGYVTHVDNGMEGYLAAYPWVTRQQAVKALDWVALQVSHYENNLSSKC